MDPAGKESVFDKLNLKIKLKGHLSDNHKVIEVSQLTKSNSSPNYREKIKKCLLVSNIVQKEQTFVSMFEFDEISQQLSTDIAIVLSQKNSQELSSLDLKTIMEYPQEEERESFNTPITSLATLQQKSENAILGVTSQQMRSRIQSNDLSTTKTKISTLASSGASL